MTKSSTLLVALLATVLAGCGGGGGGSADGDASVSATAAASTVERQDATAADGLARFNYWRAQLGMTALVREGRLDIAAQGHSDYQAINRVISHFQTPDTPGFTGECMGDSNSNPRCAPVKVSRLEQAGYAFTQPAYAFGEVISRTASTSGTAAAESLIAAIYHRFVIFEPMFKHAGAGGASLPGGSTYFTTNFTADGLDTGLGRGNFAVYPLNGQVNVTRNFYSDQEVPDPVPDLNEVGYPISVHADIFYTPPGQPGRSVEVIVQTFDVRPLGGANLPVQQLWYGVDPNTPSSVASIVPRDVLAANTTYEVSFTGTWRIRDGNGTVLDQVPMNRSWTFTTGS